MPNNITLKVMRNKEREKTPKCLQDQQLTPLYYITIYHIILPFTDR